MTRLSKVLHILIPLLLMSCSQQRKKEIKIVSNFGLESNSFKGGLSIRGVSKSSSFQINTTKSDTIRVELITGNWSFYITAWDGSAIFSGTIYCGYENLEIDSSTNAINIKVSALNCSKPIFGQRFKPLKIFNCSALLDSSSSPITENTPPTLVESNFCDDNPNVPVEKQSTAQFIQIKLPSTNNSDPSITDLVGPCTPTLGDPVSIFALPLKNIPLMIKLSDDSTCSSGINYSFPNGISGANASQSIVNLKDVNNNFLFLPFNNIKSPAVIASFLVESAIGDVLANNSTLKENDVITIKVVASDPNGLPLEYKFFKFGATTSILSEWSSTDQINYTIPANDTGINSITIRVAVRNSDGVNYLDSSFGDASATWNYKVPGSLLPATLSSFTATDNQTNLILANNSTTTLGQSIAFKANASDPNNLPLEYIFYKFGETTEVLQNWSSLSQLNYNIQSADEGIKKVTIRVGVRNNDGVNFNSASFGDATATWMFSAPGNFLPSSITSFTIIDNVSNSPLPNNSILNVGQVIRLVLNASDPNSLNMEYKFIKFGATTTILSEWSSSNEILYTVAPQDAGAQNITIRSAVRNSDGKNYESPSFGDATTTWNFKAN